MRRSRKTAQSLLLCLAVGLLAYTILWFYVAHRLKDSADVQIDIWRRAGLDLSYKERHLRGYPFTIIVDYEEIAVTLPIPAATAQIGHLLLETSLFSGLRPSPARLNDITLQTADGPWVIQEAILAGRIHFQEEKIDQLDFSLSAGAIDLPIDPGTGRRIDQAEIKGKLLEPLALPITADNLASWRDAGGTLQIDSFSFRQQRIDLSGDATVTLDEAMQPLAAGTITGRGLQTGIDQLVARNILKPLAGVLAKQVLKGLEGDTGQIKVALSIQHQYLYLDSVKLLALPKIVWQ